MAKLLRGVFILRKPGKKSDTGINHVMLRRINGQKILHNNNYERLIEAIGRYKGISEYEI